MMVAWEMLMRRREVVAILSGAAVWPVTAGAQEVGRTYRVGGLSPSPRHSPHYIALFDELRGRGFRVRS